MVTLFKAVILSIVQGITEWFPISSSGHLAIAQSILGVNDLGFVVYLHFASVLSVIVLYWKDIIDLVVKKKYKYMAKMGIAIAPVVLAGLFLREHVMFAFTNFYFVGTFFIIFGIYVYCTKFAGEIKSKPSYVDTIFIGLTQAFAILPGISRSGMVIGSSIIQGVKREEAIKFSFLVAIPLIFAASLYEARTISLANISPLVFLTSFTITLFTSLVTINILIKITKSNKFYLFGIYNVALGAIIILWNLFF